MQIGHDGVPGMPTRKNMQRCAISLEILQKRDKEMMKVYHIHSRQDRPLIQKAHVRASVFHKSRVSNHSTIHVLYTMEKLHI